MTCSGARSDDTRLFPYLHGQNLVSALKTLGWSAVDAAFAGPPVSTLQILHSEKHFLRDEPQLVALPPSIATLGAEWALVEVELLGEFQSGVYLAQQVNPETAALAAQGWDGEQHAVYANLDQIVMVLQSGWDGTVDRAGYVAAYTVCADAKYAQAPGRTEEAQIGWETGSQTTGLAWRGDQTVIFVGPDPEMVAPVLAGVTW